MSDLEVLAELREVCAMESKIYDSPVAESRRAALSRAIELMENREWISVDDRLPKQKQSNRGVKVILCLERGTVIEGVFDEGNFYCNGSIFTNVTHWMPHPQPAKEDK